MTQYDIAVIGKGLMGCGAIRHLTVSHPELKVCIIGPDEPENRKTHDGVFASHYDQGRITRVLDPSPNWGTLARQSIAQYPIIEEASGIHFHHQVGCLRATDIPDSVQQIDTCAEQFQPLHDRLDSTQCKERYPFLTLSDDFIAWDETGDAGYINPRALVKSQLRAAENKGATVIRDIVDSVTRYADHIDIQTRKGETVQAQKILITAGGYSNLLLEKKVDLWTRTHTILLAEVLADEIARLHTMPALITTFDHPDVQSLYMLPPVDYPDGKTYIKLGASGRPQELLPAEEHPITATHHADDLNAWFQSDGRQDIADILKSALHRMIPNLNALSYQPIPCLLTYTKHGNPYIDVLEEGQIYITTGGCGSAAKSSDEIGRIGARLTATGEWHSELNRDDFRAVYL
jgi:glycine/D-amino acid oxidase-like deaminating enzyme